MKTAKSIGSTYTEEQKEKFKSLMKQMRDERIEREQSMHQSMEIYDEYYFNGLPKEDGLEFLNGVIFEIDSE